MTPPTNTPSNNELDDEVFERALKFANDVGSVALGSRDYDELVKLYKEFAKDIQKLHIEALRKKGDV